MDERTIRKAIKDEELAVHNKALFRPATCGDLKFVEYNCDTICYLTMAVLLAAIALVATIGIVSALLLIFSIYYMFNAIKSVAKQHRLKKQLWGQA